MQSRKYYTSIDRLEYMAEADEVKTVGNDEQTTEDPEPYLVSDSARQSGRSIGSFVYQQTFDNTYQQKVDNDYKHSEMLEKIHKLGMEVGRLKEVRWSDLYIQLLCCL